MRLCSYSTKRSRHAKARPHARCGTRWPSAAGGAGEDRQVLLDSILAIAADPAIPDEQVGGLIRGEAIGWERLRAAHAAAFPPLPRDHGHLAALEGSYGYLRQFTQQVIDTVPFAGGTAAGELLKSVEVLRS